MTDNENWRHHLARLRAASSSGRPRDAARRPRASRPATGALGTEAVMTLVAIMNDDSDPRLQIAAAKTLLSRSTNLPPDSGLPGPDAPETALTDDELDAAIAVAKALLDELASRKAAGVSGAGALAADGASGADSAGG